MKVKLVSYTNIDQDYIDDIVRSLPTEEQTEVRESLMSPEGLTAYCARVSSNNQANPKYAKLLQYCIDNGHWSVFEMIDVTFEIETSRAIAAQILRHKSFSFQEFSQRYQSLSNSDIELYKPRRQDIKNRQNSIPDLSNDIEVAWDIIQQNRWDAALRDYQWALDNGIAKECARMILPLQTKTKLYMKGSLRSWIHYLSVRTDASTQKEHRDIAVEIQARLKAKFPAIAEACNW
jgi:thymidylate synthase (FAD)